METMYFVILRIDGDYAILKRTDIESDTEIPLARALLPFDADEGSRLKYEDFEYTIMD